MVSRDYRLSVSVLMALAALVAGGAALQSASAQSTVNANAPLGGVVTATVTIVNYGQPTTTAALYEGWPIPAPMLASEAPRAPLRVLVPDRPGPLTPELQQQLKLNPDSGVEMIVYLNDQADLRAAAAIADWDERGWAVMSALRSHAEGSQAPLLAGLRARGYEPRPYWIVNAVAVTGDGTLANWLAAQPTVALITENTLHALDEPRPEAATLADSLAWSIEKARADDVWADWGVRGAGIVVANIDTGVALSHPALLQSYRGWSAQGVTHDYNWFDPARKNGFALPSDPNGHGTHTMGTLAGGVAANGLALGMAPGARWIAARGCESSNCSDEALLASAQWVLAPTDPNYANPRPDLRPHIVSNSWGGPGEDPWYLGYVEAWNAAGIFSVFANGNTGFLGCQSSGQPGNYAASFSIGATDLNDLIATFSSRGPTSDGRIKPDLSAPGVSVPSAWPDGSVVSLSGTSMATPHVAGAAALLWSANPALIGDIAATRSLLTGNAHPLTSTQCGDAFTAVPNNVYGWGRLDVYRSVLMARVEVPWLEIPASVALPANDIGSFVATLDARQVPGPGTYQARILILRNNQLIPIPVTLNVFTATTNVSAVSGQLRDRWTGQPVYGRVAYANGPTVTTDVAGQYTLTLPNGTYPYTATALGYVPEYGTLDALTDTTQWITLTADAPHMLFSAPLISVTMPFGARHDTIISVSNEGPRPLSITLSAPPIEWSIAGPLTSAALYDASALPALALADDMVYTDPLTLPFTAPIYGQLVDRLYLSSNGWVSAVPPGASVQFAECLPGGNLPPGTLAPFWTDLDPSQGGVVRAGAVTSDTFVVSFEGVPPWLENPPPNPPTYTFQLALHADGWAEYLYGAMGLAPHKWGVGVSNDGARGQSIACNGDAQLLSGQRWQLKNQPPAPLWLSATPASFAVPPYDTAAFTASVLSVGYVPWRTEPFEGVLRLTTNDLLQPRADVLARLVTGPAPFTQWFPIIGR